MGTQGGFSFARGNLTKLLAAPRYLIGALRGRLTQRDPGLWVIGSAFGPCDGALAFARASRTLPVPPRLVWLAGSVTEAAAARAAGFDTVLDRDGEEGLAATLHAGLVAVTHGFGDVNRYGITGAVVVQLWHGAPLKKLHADSPAVTHAGRMGRLPGMARLLTWAYRRGTRQISLFPVSSPFFVPFLCSAFDLGPDRVQVLGEPRTDALFTGTESERIAASRRLLESRLGPLGSSRVLLYAPTWRDGDPDPSIPTTAQWQRIDAFGAEFDCVLVVRPHPLGVGAYTHTSEQVRLLPASLQAESMPLLWGVDALITDYSSMLVDYAVTKRPIVLLAPDLDHYRDTRGLYVDYGWLSNGRWHTSWDEVVSELRALFTDAEHRVATEAHSSDLAARFHAFDDGHNAQRVCEAAATLVAEHFSP
ncbi:MAG: CDP-glycerol glycerophosphotransferase family protein [Propionicimonas sp.]